MPNLKFLALQNNQIEEMFELRFLQKLEFLDLSGNKIKEAEVAYLPKNLFALKLLGNPLCQEGAHRFSYRKDFVLALENLDTFDKLEVLPAERMSYKGLLPKVKILNLLSDLESKTQ